MNLVNMSIKSINQTINQNTVKMRKVRKEAEFTARKARETHQRCHINVNIETHQRSASVSTLILVRKSDLTRQR